MYFKVDSRVFEKLPNYCLGIVVAKGVDNSGTNKTITNLLDDQVREFSSKYGSANVRELPNIKAFRDAFQVLGINPNKFMCSIESLTKRVQKQSQLPHINPIVDIGNALSVKYQLPMGAHDIDKLSGDMEVRFSTENDHFIAIDGEAPEIMPADELIYVSGNTVKTRRWIWRQSDDGKITGDTHHIFYPIDGFGDVSRDDVMAACNELAETLRKEFGCSIKSGFIDKSNPVFDLSI